VRRWDPEIQEAYYNGWKSITGLKHQTVDNAYGLTVDLAGPVTLRRNDLRVLRDSNINDRMAAVQTKIRLVDGIEIKEVLSHFIIAGIIAGSGTFLW
jgi:hypothetical protein